MQLATVPTKAFPMNKIFDEYGIKARLFPALLCSLPFIAIKHYIVNHYIPEDVTRQFLAVAFEDISLTVVSTYLLAQVSRFVAKALFEKKKEFPTVLMLLPSSTLMSAEYRKKIGDKVTADFQLTLPDHADETQNIDNTKTRISEIVQLIINKVGPGKLLLQHNIEYGFMRNLIGGSLVCMFISIAAAVFLKVHLAEQTGFIVASSLTVIYLIPLLFSKPILRHYSNAYAPVLFREYAGI